MERQKGQKERTSERNTKEKEQNKEKLLNLTHISYKPKLKSKIVNIYRIPVVMMGLAQFLPPARRVSSDQSLYFCCSVFLSVVLGSLSVSSPHSLDHSSCPLPLLLSAVPAP